MAYLREGKIMRKVRGTVDVSEAEMAHVVLSGDYYMDFPSINGRPEGLLMHNWDQWFMWTNQGWARVRVTK